MKTKTEAYKKAEAFRDAVNQGYTKITAKDLSCVVYIGNSATGGIWAKGYIGRATKASLYTCYKTEARRAEHVAEWMGARMDRAASKTATERQARELEVGDVLVSTWGYDQTNVDYYLVQSLFGKSGVIIVPIGKRSVEGRHYMTGDCIPDPETITGEPMRKMAQGKRVKINSVCGAYKKEPTIVAGAKIFSADHWTAYH